MSHERCGKERKLMFAEKGKYQSSNSANNKLYDSDSDSDFESVEYHNTLKSAQLTDLMIQYCKNADDSSMRVILKFITPEARENFLRLLPSNFTSLEFMNNPNKAIFIFSEDNGEDDYQCALRNFLKAILATIHQFDALDFKTAKRIYNLYRLNSPPTFANPLYPNDPLHAFFTHDQYRNRSYPNLFAERHDHDVAFNMGIVQNESKISSSIKN